MTNLPLYADLSSSIEDVDGLEQTGGHGSGGGSPGMLWVNGKVHHYGADKWYGKTRPGDYLGEAAAKARGAHPEHGKACTP